MYTTNDPSEVLEAHRRLLRLLLVMALIALTGAGVGVWVLNNEQVCTSYGTGQINNGKAIIGAGVNKGVSEDGIVAGLTAAMHETGMRNLANPNVPDSMGGNHDGLASNGIGVGILLQTPSWEYPTAVLMVPAEAAHKFFEAVADDADHGSLSPAQVAGRAQRSAFPDAYIDVLPLARQFYRDHIDEIRASRCPIPPPVAGGARGSL